MKEIPQIETAITQGELSLSNISQAQSLFRNLAKESPAEPMPKAKKVEILRKLKNKTTREGQRELLKHHPQSAVNQTFETQRPLTAEATEIKFIMTDDLKAQLDQVKTLLGPKAIGLSFAELISLMAKLSIEKLSKKKFGKRRVASEKESSRPSTKSDPEAPAPQSRPAAAPSLVVAKDITPAQEPNKSMTSTNSNNPRYIPQSMKHAVWRRDNGRCGKCGSDYNLNFDHLRPIARGGTSTIENLRLLCFSCNQREAINVFGLAILDRSVNTSKSALQNVEV